MVKNKNRLGFEAQLSRHPHHMPAAYSASLSTGMIIPQWFDIAQAGDTYKMHPKMFSRLQNVQTAFLGEVDINIKFFFVPLQMLYTPFGQIFAQTNDVISSMFKDLGSIDTFPMIEGDTLLNGLPQANFFYGHKECAGKEVARLLDAFDLNPYAVLRRRSDIPEDYEPSFNPSATPIDESQCHLPNFSPWLLAAYQAVYQKHFRNDEFEKFNIAAFNVDQYWNNSPIRTNLDLIKLRYAQRPADYFTKTRVAPILSSINKLAANSQSDTQNVGNSSGGDFDVLLNKINSWLGSGFNYISDSNSQSYSDTEGGVSGVDSTSSFASNKLASPSAAGGETPVANIRAAFALDKFLRVYGRAGKTYDEQILAHFGVKIPHDVKHDLTMIAHFHGKLQADPIYATATIGQDNASVLGQVGGQGQCTLDPGKEIKFTAPVHGVMLAVAYALTKPRYYGTFSKLNLLGSRIDFPIPEFDKLGAQPVYSFEVNPQALVFGEQIESGSPVLRFGWQNRWQQWKESYNRCSFLYAPADAFGEEQGAEYVTENAFMPWLLSRPAFYLPNTDPDSSLRAVDLWESPNALNTVMDVVYDGNWSNDYFYAPHLMLQTDPILTDFYNDVTKVSWMSPTGEPDL